MTMVRLLTIGAIVCLLNAGVRADDKKEEKKGGDYAKLIVGKWEITKSHEGGPTKGSTIEFTKDGKLKMAGDGMNFEGTYKVEGKKFVMKLKLGDNEMALEIDIKKLDDNVLETEKDGMGVDLKRVK